MIWELGIVFDWIVLEYYVVKHTCIGCLNWRPQTTQTSLKKLRKTKKTDFFKMQFGPDQDHLGVIGVPPTADFIESSF